MKLRELFDRAIEVGMSGDPRGAEAVAQALKDRKQEYEKLKDDEREYFDTESLKNPYADSRILYGTGDEEVASVLVGIDMEVGEVMLAHALNQAGRKVDAIIAHHPEGTAYAKLYEVMGMQSDILGRFGVPINAAESTMEKRIADVERSLLPSNHARAVDAAKLMGIPMINLHTPADNMVVSYLQSMLDEKKPLRLSNVMDMLLEIPEYKDAKKLGAGPKIVLGSASRTTGKCFVDMTGGTEGAKDVFASMAASGINTIVGMHFSNDHRKEAEKHHFNLVIAGHISSDNLGMNLLFDGVMKATGKKFEIMECSGYRRFSR